MILLSQRKHRITAGKPPPPPKGGTKASVQKCKVIAE
jgi:hypothetical protein